MKIFDAHISGSLSVSSSAHIEGDLTVLGTLFATVSGTTTNALTASEAPRYTLTSSFHSFTSSYTTGSFTGSFIGDGGNLYNIPASGVTGLNLNKITSGSVSASISPDRGLEVNTDLNVVGIITAKEIHTSIVTSSVLFESGSTIFGNTSDDTHQITGSVGITGSLTLNNDPVVVNTTFNSFTSSANGRLNSIETSTSSLNSFTSSADGRLSSIEGVTGSIALLNTYTGSNNTVIGTLQTSTSSLNSFTSSIDTTIKNKLNSDNVISGSAQVIITGTTGYSNFSSSIGFTTITIENRVGSLETESGSIRTDFNSYTSSNNGTNTTQNNRLTAIETSTGSLNTFTSSANGRLNSLESTSGALNTYTSSANGRLNSIETSTGSLNSFSSSTLSSLTAIHTSTGSLNTFSSSTLTRLTNLESASSSIRSDFNSHTSSANGRLNSLETSTGSLNTFTSSANGRLNSLETTTGALTNIISTINGRIGAIETSTGSLNSFSSSTLSSLTAIHTSTSSLNSYTSSNNTRLGEIETSTSSLNSFTSSINTTIKNRLNTEGVISGSVQVTISNTTGYSTFSSSLATTDLGQDNRLTSLEGKTGSYATTGSNVFQGDQTITGSLYISQNLIIAGSSSIQHITSSQLNIGDNIITVNAQNPSIRFGGLAVIDSGSSPQVSGSILFDSVNNQWIFVHQNQSTVTSSVLLMGPETYNNLGGESYIAQNKIIKSTGIEHLAESNITDTGTKVSINSNTEITGTFVATGTALVSGSSQISFNGITDKPALVSGSSQITFLSISSIPSGLVSGSSQVLNGSGVWSGSAQLPSGVVSGSSQITFGSISSIPSGLVSGSSQITFGSISSIPSGLVSGSSQITFGSISSIPSGLVSGSSQIAIASTSGFGTYLNQALLTTSSPTFAAITVGKSGTDSTITFPAQTNDPGYIKHYESNNTAIMYFNVSDDTTDEFHFGYSADASTFRLRADGVVLEGTWQGSAIGDSYISSASNWNTAYNKRPSSLGFTSSTVTLTLGDGSTVTASVPTFNQNTTGNAGYATTAGALTSMNISQFTNNSGYITSYTETDTLSSVTARGASTSTAISINNTLTVTSGRLIVRTGGANTYGIVSGYDNSNHLMTFRADIAGSTSSPTLTAGHQMCFVEYAEANDTTGWFFKSSSTGTYQEIARITRSTFNYNGYTVLHSSNYNSYSPTLTGTGASGTWGISITGNAATLGNISASGFWQAGGSWAADLSSNGYTRQIGLAYTGGEFSILTNNSQISTLIDGTYFAGEQGGFYSMNSSNQFSSRVGFNRDSSGNASFNASIVPTTNGTLNLGSSSARWNTVFTSDLSMSNGIGDYTIVEGEEDLFIYNNKTNKVFKFLLQEVDPSIVPPKKI